MPDTGSAATLSAPRLLRVAHVRRVHGVRGEVRAEMLGGGIDRFTPGTVLQCESDGRPLTVASTRPLGGDEVLLAFDELRSRESAASLAGSYLSVHRDRARPLADEEWFVWQLVGLRAVSADGAELGVVRDVENHPASDVIVVGNGTAEHRYPMVREWVRAVDVAAGVVVVTPWPEADE